MTGPEHYAEAERMLQRAGEIEDPDYYLAAAQVHATLALAAECHELVRPRAMITAAAINSSAAKSSRRAAEW